MSLTFIYPELVKALGWTLLHSLWQGLVVCTILMVLLAVLKNRSPQFRYLLSLTALVGLLLWMIGTFGRYFPEMANPKVIVPSEFAEVGEEIDLWTIESLNTPAVNYAVETNWEQNLGQLEQLLAAFIDKHAGLLVKIWLLGVLLFATRWLASVYYTYRLRSIKTNTLPALWQEELNTLAAAIGITKKIHLLESAKVDVPLIVGHLQPVILLPIGALTGLTPEQVRAILVHELAHIRRYDFLINMILSSLEVILFYHPAFWWMANIIRQEREKCCDDIAVAACGNAKFYARTLLIMEEKRQQRSLAMAFQGNKNQLLNRIKRICLGPQYNQRNDVPKAGLIFGLLLSFGFLAWANLPADFEELANVVMEETADDCEPTATVEQPLMEAVDEMGRTEMITKEEMAPVAPLVGKKIEAVISTAVSNNSLAAFLLIDTVPYPKLSELKSPDLKPFPEFEYSFEQLQAEHEKGTSYQDLIEPYKGKIDAWRDTYSEDFLKHWQARQTEIHQSYQQWVGDVKKAHQGDDLGAAIELYRSRAFEKALRSQEREMSKSEREVSRNVERRIKDIERALQSFERKQEDDDKRHAIHDDRMAMHDLRMSVHDIRMHMHDARMSVHDTRMAMHNDRMAAHDIVMKAFKKELIENLMQDGLIKNQEDDIDLMVKDGQVEFNGKNLSEEQSKKYLDLIKRYGFRVHPKKTWGVKLTDKSTSIGTFSTKREE